MLHGGLNLGACEVCCKKLVFFVSTCKFAGTSRPVATDPVSEWLSGLAASSGRSQLKPFRYESGFIAGDRLWRSAAKAGATRGACWGGSGADCADGERPV